MIADSMGITSNMATKNMLTKDMLTRAASLWLRFACRFLGSQSAQERLFRLLRESQYRPDLVFFFFPAFWRGKKIERVQLRLPSANKKSLVQLTPSPVHVQKPSKLTHLVLVLFVSQLRFWVFLTKGSARLCIGSAG
jgi:hypothetical protein